MLNINVAKIKSSGEELKRVIEKYEENVMILAKQIQDCELEWHDDNSAKFFSRAEKQKSELKEFLTSLKKVDTTYEDIVNKILLIKSNINTLFIDETYKSTIKNSYVNAINDLTSISTKLSNLQTYFCTYYERSAINAEISRIKSAKMKLEAAKNNIENLFSRFSSIEGEITAAITKLEINTISIMDLDEFL